MIWDLKTVRQVEHLYVEGLLDEHHLGSFAEFHEILATRLKHEAHALAVEVDVRDVQFRDTTEDDDRNKARRRARGAWSPLTREVEMRGGEQDGVVATWERLGEPLRFPKRQGVMFVPESEMFVMPPDRPFDVDTYELAGWSEADRHWVYDINA